MKPFSSEGLASRARSHWTPERLQRLMAGKKLPLHPVTHAAFLHVTGLMSEDASDLVRRVENGEDVTITVDGRPIAVLRPLEQRKRWMMRDEFVARFARNQADAGLTAELVEIVPETTDDIELR